MSLTRYFVLSTPDLTKLDCQQVVTLPRQPVHILPMVNLDYYLKNGLFEAHLIQWCKQLCSKDKLFLDIGAHSGTYTVTLADDVKAVYSFEPQKATYYALCGSVALSGKHNVTCLQVGLGAPEQVGKMPLKIVSADGGGSSLHSTSGVLMVEEVQIRTLDSYELEDVGFIKMDVEENELFVLMGGLNTIRKSQYPKILFESNYNNTKLFDYVRSIGYKEVIAVSGCHNMYLAVV